ncbi:MAG: hypothetical protein FD147_2476 [Chloroflexi bacterium]|nr:MAG: hypothetical protein FD147_2476 [Chloroflexota bacterium]
MPKWTGNEEAIFFNLPRSASVIYDNFMRGSPVQ